MPQRHPRTGRVRASLCHRHSGQGSERNSGGSHLQLPGLGQEVGVSAGQADLGEQGDYSGRGSRTKTQLPGWQQSNQLPELRTKMHGRPIST